MSKSDLRRIFRYIFFGFVHRYFGARKPGIKTQSRDAILATAAFSDEDKKNGDPQLFARDKTYRMHDSSSFRRVSSAIPARIWDTSSF